MTPKQKHQEEQNELKTSRINRILESAFAQFANQGIDSITMNDIAKKAEIGVASLYRYFETKDEVAIRTAIWAWNKQKDFILPGLQNEDFEKASGYCQLEKICNLFGDIYEKQGIFLRFVYFFDSYIVRQKIAYDRLSDYESMILTVQNIIASAMKKGFEDGSLKIEYKDKQNDLYFTMMHSLFSLSQKLALSDNMLEMDSIVQGRTQINLLSSLMLGSLKN